MFLQQCMKCPHVLTLKGKALLPLICPSVGPSTWGFSINWHEHTARGWLCLARGLRKLFGSCNPAWIKHVPHKPSRSNKRTETSRLFNHSVGWERQEGEELKQSCHFPVSQRPNKSRPRDACPIKIRTVNITEPPGITVSGHHMWFFCAYSDVADFKRRKKYLN